MTARAGLDGMVGLLSTLAVIGSAVDKGRAVMFKIGILPVFFGLLGVVAYLTPHFQKLP